MLNLPAKPCVASFDVDAQNTFTPICPNELPVAGGNEIAPELDKQAAFSSVRVASRDAHCLSAVWLADENKPQFSPVNGHPNCDIHWAAHAIVGTKGFDFISGLDEKNYDFQVYKGVQPDMHPYGACYHDLANTLSTGVIEYLHQKNITTVIVGGLATDYCVKNTALQLADAGFTVVLNLAACRGISPDSIEQAITQMQQRNIQIINSASELSQ